MVDRYYSNTAQETQLQASINSADVTISVGGTAGFPASVPYTLVLDADGAGEEVVTVTNVAGTTLTVTRGEDGTPATSHDAGAVVKHYHTARDFRDSRAHEEAASGVHGLSGTVVGTSDTQTLTNKDLSDATNTLAADVVKTTATQTVTNKTLGATNTINGFTADRFMRSDGTGKLDASTKTVPAGDVVGTTDTQSLSNKNLTATSNTFPYGGEEAFGTVTDATAHNLNGTETVVLSTTVTIPAHWGTYDIQYGAVYEVNGTDPTAVRSLTVIAYWGSSSSTAVNGTQVSTAPKHTVGASGGSNPSDLIAYTGGSKGLSGTGTKRLNITGRLGANDSYVAQERHAWVKAVRTS